MTNREKFSKQILDIACNGNAIAVNKHTGKLASCDGTHCRDCEFSSSVVCCEEKTKQWSNAEYIEKPKISKKDKMFLDYILDDDCYIIRNQIGWLFMSATKPEKKGDCWKDDNGGCFVTLARYAINLPMVKIEDTEPWQIKDLKQLEIVDKY